MRRATTTRIARCEQAIRANGYELHQLSQRFGTQPERYARSGVKLHIGQ